MACRIRCRAFPAVVVFIIIMYLVVGFLVLRIFDLRGPAYRIGGGALATFCGLASLTIYCFLAASLKDPGYWAFDHRDFASPADRKISNPMAIQQNLMRENSQTLLRRKSSIEQTRRAHHFPCATTKANGLRRFCRKCQAFKPDRCHHCYDCRACVMKMDHVRKNHQQLS